MKLARLIIEVNPFFFFFPGQATSLSYFVWQKFVTSRLIFELNGMVSNPKIVLYLVYQSSD
jgi:hypothetical protein